MNDQITIKGKFKYIKRGDQISLSYFGHLGEEPTVERGRRREEEKKRGRREEKEEGEGEEKKCMNL